MMIDLTTSTMSGFTVTPTNDGKWFVVMSTVDGGTLVTVVMSRQQIRDLLGVFMDVLAGPAS